MPKLTIRAAEVSDISEILAFILDLAVYEKLEDQVVVTAENLREQLFEQQRASCLIALEEATPVGFALYFYNFSTFLGRPGLYLEDLFIKPEFRGRGYGKQLLLHLRQVAIEQGCGRMEWSVLDWNTPAIDFYKSLGAVPMKDWTVFRMTLD